MSESLTSPEVAKLRALTYGQVAELLTVSDDTVRRLCDTGRLRSISIGVGGRRKARRVLVRDLETYIAAEAAAPAAPARRRRRTDPNVTEYIR